MKYNSKMNEDMHEPFGCSWHLTSNNHSDTPGLIWNQTEKLQREAMRCSTKYIIGVVIAAITAILVWIIGGRFWYLLYRGRIARTLNNSYMAVFVAVTQLECVVLPMRMCILGDRFGDNTMTVKTLCVLRVTSGCLLLVDRLLFIKLGIQYNPDKMQKIGIGVVVITAVCAVCYATVGTLYLHVHKVVILLRTVLVLCSLVYNVVVVMFSVVVYRINSRSIPNVPDEHQIRAGSKMKLMCLCVGYAMMSLWVLLMTVIALCNAIQQVQIARDYICLFRCLVTQATLWNMLWFMYTNKDIWPVMKKIGIFKTRCVAADVPAQAN